VDPPDQISEGDLDSLNPHVWRMYTAYSQQATYSPARYYKSLIKG